MKNSIKELIRALTVGIILPIMLIGSVFLGRMPVFGEGETVPTQTGQPETVPLHTSLPPVQETTEPERPATYVAVILENTVCRMELESYILGVVLGEMPADFEMEALKAQAVVARTYTLKACREGTRHSGAVCTSPSCCQAYCDPTDYLQRGGTEARLNRVRTAVEETEGQVLTYEGKLINATYFSCSGGNTEDAKAVWGYEVPYLQSVESPGEEGASVYEKKVSYSGAEFQEKLAVRLTGKPKKWFGKVQYTQGGGVETMEIGGVTYRGTTLRSLLKLRSTNFKIVVEGDTIHIYTKGYGHRVGMSQYGADAMAVTGSTYAQILAHYYQNTQLLFMEDI